MDRRILLYRQVLGWFAHYDITQPKDIPVTDAEGVPVEDPNYIRQVDTTLPYYLGTTINIFA